MANLNNKITFSSDGKSFIERVFSGKTLSEIKSMSKEERQQLTPRNTGVSTISGKTAVEFVKNSKPESNSVSTNSVKSAPAKLEFTPRPQGTVKTERPRRKTESTQYTEPVSGQTRQSSRLSSVLPDYSSTEFISGTVDYSFGAGQGYGFNGEVYSIAQATDGTIYIGGDFGEYTDNNGDYIYCPYLVSLNPDGTINYSFDTNNLNGGVNAIAVQPDGKIIIGGAFNVYNYGPGYSCPYIARLNPDGSFDTTFFIGGGFNDNVNSIVIQPDGKILVGGNFTDYNGTFAGRIIRLNSNGSVDNTFTSGTEFDDNVYTIKLQPNGKILVGGYFSLYDGITQNRISRLNTDGTIDTSFNTGTGFNNYVNSIDLQSDGKIIVGGNFWDTGNYNGTPCESIVRLNTDGSLDSTFGMGVSDEVTVVKVQPNDKILVGGYFGAFFPEFNNYSSVGCDELIRYNADTTFDYSFYYDELLNAPPFAIELQSDGKILIGGAFSNSGQPSVYPLNNFGRLNNAIPTYTYVYTVISDCTGYNTKTYTVGSNVQFSENDLYRTISFKPLNSEVDVLCGYLSIGYNDDFGRIFFPYGEPEYEYVQTYDYGDCETCITDNNKYVRAYNPLSDDYDYFYVNNKFVVGDFFFINETLLPINNNIRGCFQITEEQSSDGSDYSPIPYVPYLTCEECVEANGVIYSVSNWDVNWSTDIISYQYFEPNQYPAIILPNSPTHANYVWGSSTYFGPSEDKVIAKIYSTPTFLDNDNPIPPFTIPKLMEQKGDGQLNYSFNSEFIDELIVGFNDWVFTTKEQPDGKILVGGFFSQYNGSDVSNCICRLNSDGTIDNTFNVGLPQANGIYIVETLSDQSILIGGDFYYGMRESSSWINQTNGDGTIVRNTDSWTLTGPDDDLSNGWSYVKRQFNYTGSITLYYDWFTNDDLDYDNPFYYVSTDEPFGDTNIDFNDNIFVESNSEQGTVTISFNEGDWVSIGVYSDDSVSGPGILKISQENALIKTNKYGVIDSTFYNNINSPNGFSGPVNTILLLPDGTILVGGDFESFNNYTVDGFVKLNSNGTINEGFENTKVFFNNAVNTITLQDDGKILVGGRFANAYDPTTDDTYDVGYIVRLNSNGSLDFTFNGHIPAVFSTETPFSGVTAQYIRWTITDVKDNVSTTTQVSELYLTLNGQQIGFNYGVASCTNPDGTNPAGEEPSKLIDDDIATKWTDTSWNVNGESVIIIDNGSPINFDGYKYYTGDDFPERDPITWSLDISDDGLTWTNVSLVSGATITDDREASTQIFPVTPNNDFGGSIYFNDSILDAYTDTFVWNIGTMDFTFEWFQKFEGDTSIKSTVFSYSDTYISTYFQNGTIIIYVNGDEYTFGLDENISDNWWHFAITRESGLWRVFQNGYQLGSFTNGINFGEASPFRVGAPTDYLIENNGQGAFTGYITNVRVTNDNALYTSNFTPPTQPLSHDNEVSGNTILLLSVLNANDFILDSSDDEIETSLVTTNGGFNNIVNKIVINTDGKIFVGGSFDVYNGSYVGNYLIKLDIDGTKDSSFTIGDGFNGDITSIAVQRDGKVLVGGFFNIYNRDNVQYSYDIIRLENDGTADPKFVPLIYGEGFSNPVMNIELMSDGNSIVSGWFNYYDYGASPKVGDGGAVVKLYTSDSITLTEIFTCNNDELDFIYLPVNTNSNIVLKGVVNKTDAICGFVNDPINNTKLISGSNDFNGGDNLIVNNSSDGLYPRTSDFTFEWFQNRIDDDGQNSRVFSIGSYNNPAVTIAVSFENGYNFTLWLNETAYYFGDLDDNGNWVHFAITRQNNLIRVFYNGVEIFSNNTGLPILFMGDLNNDNGDDLNIGNESNPNSNGQYYGLITNFRYIKGKAIYTSNFEVPVSPLQSINGDNYNTLVLLLSSTEETLIDNSGDNYYNITQGEWDGNTTSFASDNPFDNSYKLFNSNGTTLYEDCSTCLDTELYKSIMYVRDGINPDRVERHSIRPYVVTDNVNLGPIFTLRRIECYEILNYFY